MSDGRYIEAAKLFNLPEGVGLTSEGRIGGVDEIGYFEPIVLKKIDGGMEFTLEVASRLGIQAELWADGYRVLPSELIPDALVWRKP